MKKLVCTILTACLMLSLIPFAFGDELSENIANSAKQFENVSDNDLNNTFLMSVYAMHSRGLLTEDQLLDIIAVATNTERPDGKAVGSSQLVEYIFSDGTYYVGPTIHPDKYEIICTADNTQDTDLTNQLNEVYANSNMPESIYNSIMESGMTESKSSGMVITVYKAENTIDQVYKLKLNDKKTIILEEGQYIEVKDGTIKLVSVK